MHIPLDGKNKQLTICEDIRGVYVFLCDMSRSLGWRVGVVLLYNHNVNTAAAAHLPARTVCPLLWCYLNYLGRSRYVFSSNYQYAV